MTALTDMTRMKNKTHLFLGSLSIYGEFCCKKTFPVKKQLHQIAEKLVMDIEKKRIKKPIQVSKLHGTQSGYDIESGHRHIEVKSSGKKITWLQLTHNETNAYAGDPEYYIYLVEFNEVAETADVYAIPKKELKQMEIPKNAVRFSALGSKEKRKDWLLKKGLSYKKYT